MSVATSTRQTLDPAGATGSYPTAVAISAIAFAVATLAGVQSIPAGRSSALSIVALVLFGSACAVVVASARPTSAPFTGRAHFSVHALVLVAVGFSAVANWESDGSFLDRNWAALGLGILTIAVAPYRPARELVAAGSISAVFISAVTLVQAEWVESVVPPLSLAAGSAIAVLAFCCGNAAYTASSIRSLQRARARHSATSDALADELRNGIARAVQDDRTTILARDIVPFLTGVLDRRQVTGADRSRALSIADAVRGVMVAEANRSWLDTLVAHLVGQPWRRVHLGDESRLASAMDTRQRTSLRALIVAIDEDPDAGDLSIELRADGACCSGVIRVRMGSPDGARARYAPYFSVMRVAFVSSTVSQDRSDLIARFTFECD